MTEKNERDGGKEAPERACCKASADSPGRAGQLRYAVRTSFGPIQGLDETVGALIEGLRSCVEARSYLVYLKMDEGSWCIAGAAGDEAVATYLRENDLSQAFEQALQSLVSRPPVAATGVPGSFPTLTGEQCPPLGEICAECRAEFFFSSEDLPCRGLLLFDADPARIDQASLPHLAAIFRTFACGVAGLMSMSGRFRVLETVMKEMGIDVEVGADSREGPQDSRETRSASEQPPAPSQHRLLQKDDGIYLVRRFKIGGSNGDGRPVAVSASAKAVYDNGDPPHASGRVRLTRRQRDVLFLVANGLSDREVAERLCISIHTAKDHVKAILKATGARNRTELASLVFNLNGRR